MKIFKMVMMVSFVVLFFASCNTTKKDVDAQHPDFAMGTMNDIGTIHTYLVLSIPKTHDPTPPEGIQLTLQPPENWNDGKPLNFTIWYDKSGTFAWSWWWWNDPPVHGPYKVTGTFPGYGTVTETLYIDPKNILDYPKPRLKLRKGEIEVSWDAIAGARSYTIVIYKRDDNGHNQFVDWWPTTSTNIKFINIDDMTPNTPYFASVLAHTYDRTKAPIVLSEQENMSRGISDDAVLVTETGQLQLVPRDW